MEAILKAIKTKRIKNVIPRIVISNNPNAQGLRKAAGMGIATMTLSDNTRGWDYDKKLANVLKEHMVDTKSGLVCLAGYMRILSSEFVNLYRGRIMNIHPSLLPSFAGLHAQKQALDYGVKVSGCTVHFVDEGVDSGPIIGQIPVYINDNETADTLSSNILEKEHELYIECIKLFADNRLYILGRRVITAP